MAQGSETTVRPAMEGKAQRPWTLRYKEGPTVFEGTILASTLDRAEAVGRTYCDLVQGRRFISVRDPVLADEGILRPTEKTVEETEWTALTNVERLARMQGKTMDEVLEGLRKHRQVSPLQAQEEKELSGAKK